MPYRDPDRQRAAQREHARRRRAVEPDRRTLGPLVDGDLRLQTASDVLAVLAGQVEAVLADEELATTDRARTIATLAGVSLRAIEAADLAGRVEAIEAVLSERRKAARP
jgi:hypothetical protein